MKCGVWTHHLLNRFEKKVIDIIQRFQNLRKYSTCRIFFSRQPNIARPFVATNGQAIFGCREKEVHIRLRDARTIAHIIRLT